MTVSVVTLHGKKPLDMALEIKQDLISSGLVPKFEKWLW